MMVISWLSYLQSYTNSWIAVILTNQMASIIILIIF